MDQNAFVKIVTLVVPNYQVADVLENVGDVDAITDDTKAKQGEAFWHSLIKDIMAKGSVEGLMKIGTWILSKVPVTAIL